MKTVTTKYEICTGVSFEVWEDGNATELYLVVNGEEKWINTGDFKRFFKNVQLTSKELKLKGIL
jgi:hypothetical protein